MHSYVIAINVVGRPFLHCRIELKANASLQFLLKALGGPAVFQEQELEAGAFPVLAQLFALAENLCHSLQNRDHLMPVNESVQTNREMRIGGKTATHAQ